VNIARSVAVGVIVGSLVAGNPVSAQDINLAEGGTELTWSGMVANARAGAWLDRGDVGSDGAADLIVGSPGVAGQVGRVHVIFSTSLPRHQWNFSEAHVTLLGLAPDDLFGTATAAGAILRTEGGVRDLAVGAPGAMPGGRPGAGAIYLFSGPLPAGTRDASSAVFTVLGAAGDGIGVALATADLDNDGYREIIVGAPGNNRVYVFNLRNYTLPATVDLATEAATLTLVAAPPLNGQRFGAVLAAGELTGPETDLPGEASPPAIYDLVIGVPEANQEAGQVFVLKGRRGWTFPATLQFPAAADAIFSGVDAGDRAGATLRVLDLDSDKQSDLAIGAPGGDGPGNQRPGAGEVYLLWGGGNLTSHTSLAAASVTFWGAASGYATGTRLAHGDINRDTPNDLVFLSPGSPRGPEVTVYYGRRRSSVGASVDLANDSNVDRRIYGLPIQAISVHEVTGEGARDILVAAPDADTEAGVRSGVVHFVISPRLELSTRTINVTAPACGSEETLVTVSNPSVIEMPWSPTTSSAWIKFPQPAQVAVAGAPSTLRVIADAGPLAPGSYSSTFDVVSQTRHLHMFLRVTVNLMVVAGDPVSSNRHADFTGNGCGDLALFRPSNGSWHVPGAGAIQVGQAGDIPVPGDYDGDGLAEAAVFRRADATWHFSDRIVQHGMRGDLPVPADYNGDGRLQIAVFRPATGSWHIEGEAPVPWGVPGDIPVPADYDGDGRADLAIYRPAEGRWRIQGQPDVLWGIQTDIPVPADYDGDGRADIAVYRRADSAWHVRGQFVTSWGQPGDIPLALDVDRDRRADLVVYRPGTRTWLAYSPAVGVGRTLAAGQAGIPAVALGSGVRAFLCRSSCGPATDFNRDGSPDLVWQQDASRQATLWYMGGTQGNDRLGWSWLATNSLPGWRIRAIADFNGDGIPDLVWQNDTTRRATVWYMGGPGGTVRQGWNWLTPNDLPGWTLVAAADVNRDMTPDLLWQHDTTGQVIVWFMGGAQGHVVQQWKWLVSSDLPNWRVAGLADLDGDGFFDVVWQERATSRVTVWYMDGDGTSRRSWRWLSETTLTGWKVIGLADFNSDGTPDLVWQNDSSREITVWYMGGAEGHLFRGWSWLTSGAVPGWTAMMR
jgi:hypothetical protein